MYELVTDPELLKKLNGERSQYEAVTDPLLLQKLNGEPAKNKPQGVWNTTKNAASILGEDISNIPGAIGNMIGGGINVAPEQLGGFAKQFYTQPVRYAKNLISGAGKIPQSLANITPDIEEYLQKLGLKDPTDPRIAEIKNKLGMGRKGNPLDFIKPSGPEQPGDALLQGLPSAAFFFGQPASAGVKLAGKAVNKVTGKPQYQALQEKLGISNKQIALNEAETQAEKAKLAHEQSLAPHEQAVNTLEEKKSAYELAQESNEAAKTAATEEVGKAAADSMKFEMNKNKKSLEEIDKNISGLSHQMDNLEKVPQTKVTDIGHIENRTKATQAAEEAQRNLELAEEHHAQALTNVTESEKPIGEHLRTNAQHDVQVAKRVNKVLEENKKEIGSGYKALEEEYKNRNIQLDNSEAIKQKTSELTDYIKQGESHSKEALAVVKELEKLKSTSSMSAADYLRAYRSATQFAREARSKAYQPGMNAEERASWKQKYENLDSLVDEMGQILESGVGAENFGQLQKLNSRWREEVVPLYGNSVYQKMSKFEQMSDNIIKSLRGSKEKGHQIIKNAIKNDPEALRHAVGQRFKANKGQEVYNPNETMAEYLDQLPEVKQLIEHRGQHLERVEKAKSNIELAKKQHAEAKTKASEATKASEQEKQNAIQQAKEYDQRVKEREGKKSNLQKEMTEHYEKRKALEEKTPLLEKHHKELKKKESELKEKHKELKAAAKEEKLNLSQKMKLEREAKAAQTKWEKAKKDVEKAQMVIDTNDFGIRSLTNGIGRLIKRAAMKFIRP